MFKEVLHTPNALILSTLYSDPSRYTSTPILKIRIIAMGLDFYFGASFRRNHVDFLPSGWQAKLMF